MTEIEVNVSELISGIENAIERGDFQKAREILGRIDPAALVDVLNTLDRDDRIRIIPYIDLLKLGSYINKLNDEVIRDIEKLKGVNELLELVYWLPIDDAVDLLQRLSPRTINRLFKLMSRRKARELATLLRYNPESIGGIMTTRIPVFHTGYRVADVIEEYVRGVKTGFYDRHYYIYIVDFNGKLRGWLDAKTLLVLNRDKLIDEVISKPPVVIYPEMDREEAAKLAVKYDLVELPVADRDRKLIGAVTIDDILDVAVSEYSEDLMKIGGFLEIVRTSYIGTSIYSLVKRRVLPILFLYLMNSVTGAVVASFSKVIEKIAVLAAFLPMLADNSGNVGSQASALIIRGLALGEIKPRDLLKVMYKEVVTSLLMSLLLIPVAFTIAFSVSYIATAEYRVGLAVGSAVTIALFVSMITSDVIGALLPIILVKAKLDPATASAPLITTISDIVTAVTYFVSASLLASIFT